MQILTFKYTKPDGKVSERVLLTHGAPSKLWSGTDITALDDESQVAYAQAVQQAKDKYLEAVKELNDRFDLNHSFRQFKPEAMSEVIEEEI